MKLPIQPRTGVTLLEVIFAMAIFLMAMVAIWQLMLLGSDRAMEVRLQARTSARCQGKLAEVIVSNTPISSAGSYSAFDDADADLQWKLEVSDEIAGLKMVRVWVKGDLQGRSVETMLSQMVLDPATRGSTFDLPDAPKYPSSSTME